MMVIKNSNHKQSIKPHGGSETRQSTVVKANYIEQFQAQPGTGTMSESDRVARRKIRNTLKLAAPAAFVVGAIAVRHKTAEAKKNEREQESKEMQKALKQIQEQNATVQEQMKTANAEQLKELKELRDVKRGQVVILQNNCQNNFVKGERFQATAHVAATRVVICQGCNGRVRAPVSHLRVVCPVCQSSVPILA